MFTITRDGRRALCAYDNYDDDDDVQTQNPDDRYSITARFEDDRCLHHEIAVSVGREYQSNAF